MPYNPSPEVQIARDAADAIGRERRVPPNRCIVLYTLPDGRMGYASWGADSSLCGQARRFADVCYSCVYDGFRKIIDAHHAADPDGYATTRIDWDAVERQTVERVRLLRAASERAFPDTDNGRQARHLFIRDLALPALSVLYRFFECVKKEDE